MPSILPILSYDVSIQDGAGSDLETSAVVFKGELHSSGSGSTTSSTGGGSSSVLKKHPSGSQELHDNKKKAHLESSVTEKGEKDAGVESGSIGDSVKLMKKAVFAVQTTLYNGLRSSAQLHAATKLLTQAEYSDVVTERSNDKQCGYPLCANGLKVEKKPRKGRYHISLSQHKVYDLEEMRQFCSTGCAVASKSYGACLRVNHEAVLEQVKLEEIVASVRGLSLAGSPISSQGLVVLERPEEPQPELDFSGSPSEVEGYAPKKYVGSDGKPLKSALKQSPRKHQRITWADEAPAAAPQLVDEDDSFSFMVDRSFDEELVEGGVKERLGIAQGLAAALSEAAVASSHGEVDSSKAALSAGLAIMPPDEEEVRFQGPVSEEVTEKEFSLPASDATDSPEQDELSDRSDWYDGPPDGFRAELSEFGSIWSALDGWVSTETLAYIYARESAMEEFRSVNGRAVADVAGSSCAEILRTISGCVSRALPVVVQALGISVPISVIELAVGHLLKTMNFVHAVPPFTTKNWRLITVLLLDVLSMRLSALATPFSGNRGALRKLVQECGSGYADYEALEEILLPLGRLPSMSGA